MPIPHVSPAPAPAAVADTPAAAHEGAAADLGEALQPAYLRWQGHWRQRLGLGIVLLGAVVLTS